MIREREEGRTKDYTEEEGDEDGEGEEEAFGAGRGGANAAVAIVARYRRFFGSRNLRR